MTDATKQGRPAGVLPFPPAANRDTLTVAQLDDIYVAAYKGRDSSRLHYLSEWVARLATARMRELDADRIAHPNETGTHLRCRQYRGIG